MMEKHIGVQVHKINEGENHLTISIEGNASDEIDLISQSIQTLIKQIDLKEMCSGDEERFNQEMKKILFSLADNYGVAGLYDAFSLYGRKKKVAKIEDENPNEQILEVPIQT